MVELAYTAASKTAAERHEGSTPSIPTKMEIEHIKYRLKKDTMLLPRVGKETVYFVVEDRGVVLDVLAVTDDNEYDYYTDVDRKLFKLHPNWAYYLEEEEGPMTHK